MDLELKPEAPRELAAIVRTAADEGAMYAEISRLTRTS
jgi:hypothetical protein